MRDWRKYLDPRALSRIARLELKARLIVEGYISGLHRSPYHGFSVEFAQHREYVPGDDIRHVDWKVFGRSDRFYVKEYEEETNMRVYVLLDVSESMAYGAPGGIDKVTYARYVAAAISFLALRQQDAVGIALFDDDVRAFIPPASTRGHLQTVLAALEQVTPLRPTGIGAVLTRLAAEVHRRSLIVIISDVFDDLDRVEHGLRLLRHGDNEVILFHVLADDEVAFPFTRMTLFEGLENRGEALADPPALRKAYIEEVDAFRADLRRRCRRDRADYVFLTTGQSFDVPLATYLVARERSRAR
jgi:uncharacterized protein (DUF58 family)